MARLKSVTGEDNPRPSGDPDWPRYGNPDYRIEAEKLRDWSYSVRFGTNDFYVSFFRTYRKERKERNKDVKCRTFLLETAQTSWRFSSVFFVFFFFMLRNLLQLSDANNDWNVYKERERIINTSFTSDELTRVCVLAILIVDTGNCEIFFKKRFVDI